MSSSLTASERNSFLRKRGIVPANGVEREGAADGPHPSKGGAPGYPQSFKDYMLEQWFSGCPMPKSMLSSLRRWSKDSVAKQMSGGKQSHNAEGNHRYLLAFFKKFFPHASCSQCAAFIALHSGDGKVLTNNEITRALKDMNMTRKRASTVAYQAFTPVNLHKHFKYWNYNFPGGIADVPRRRMIDIDECGIQLNMANENYGHAVQGLRVRKIGNYGRGRTKITIIMAIEPGDPHIPWGRKGSIARPRLWYNLSTSAGTSTQAYIDFLRYDLMRHFYANEEQRTLLNDNLSSHLADEVYDTVYSEGHRITCRVPYRPHEAPIEFAFDQLACELRRRWHLIKDEKQLINNIHDILQNKTGMGGFNDLFKRCGYIYDGEPDGGSNQSEHEVDMDTMRKFDMDTMYKYTSKHR